jgi:hypothetical protein
MKSLRSAVALLVLIVLGTMAGFLFDGVRAGIAPVEALNNSIIYILWEAALFTILLGLYLFFRVTLSRPQNGN